MSTKRRTPGTHTMRRLPRKPLTVASATFSGVVANGTGFIPVVIAEFTNPGRTTNM